ncbi:MAG: hypothetical protein N2246_09185 [Candidatus Sumerlaeia bacterium]|nr:hypothetical protein [Candidatus Sumerlaeia bacterium]
MKLRDQFEFDWKFYLVSIVAIVLVAGAFIIAYNMLISHQGRKVHKLLTTTNLADIEYSRKSALNYVRSLVLQHNLTPAEQKTAEDIFTRAFQERMNIWIEDRLNGRSEAYTRQRQAKSWDKHQQEFQQLLRKSRTK